MVDYALARKSRNIASSMVHIFLNLLLGVGSVLVTVLSGSPAIGLILVLASKWRVFAVRSRYLWLNFKSNLVDFIVGISVVLLAYFGGTEFLPVDFILMIVYSVWLLFIKPLSSENAAFIQSLFAVAIGVSASTIAGALLDPIVVVLSNFVIGYATSRHVLVQSENSKDFTLSTLLCGLIFAEITWLSFQWSIIYVFGGTGIRIPQLAIVLSIVTFVYNYTRRVVAEHPEDFRFRYIVGPLLFGIILIGILMIWFSDPAINFNLS